MFTRKPPGEDPALEARVEALEVAVANLNAEVTTLVEITQDHEQRLVALETTEPEPPDVIWPEPPDVIDLPPFPEPVPPANPANSVTLSCDADVLNYPLQFGRAFCQGEITHYPEALIDGVAALTQADVKNRWPDGSVKFAVISCVVPTIPAGVPVVLTFRNQRTGRTRSVAGYALADQFPEFDAIIRIQSGTASREASARTMLEQGDYVLWTSGAVATTVVYCDRSAGRVHDIGWSDYRPLHPWFVVTFWPGEGRVWTRFVGEIANTEALQAQTYDLTIIAGDEVVYGQTGIAQRVATRWTRAYWHGDPPEAEVSIDHNAAYLAQTRLIACYDTGAVLPDAAIATRYETWLSTDRRIGGVGHWQQYMPSTGARLDIGLATSWHVQWLLSGDWRLREIALGQSELAGAWTRHMREGDHAKANAGRSVTCYGRPTYWYMDGRYTPTAEDAVTIIDAGADDGWFADDAHQPDPHTIPYLLTGDPYWLDALELWHGANSLTTNPYWRNYAHMTVYGSGQVRAAGWTYRTMFNAAALMPDADPMKPVFVQMIDEAIAKDEGQRHINTTEFAGTSQHVFGARVIGTKDDGWGGHGPPPCRWWSTFGVYYATDPALYDTEICYGANAHWMVNFVICALGRGRELGYPVDALLEWVGQNNIGQLTTPGLPPQLASQYTIPDSKFDPAGAAWFASWAEALNGWSDQKKTGLLADGTIDLHYWAIPTSYWAYAMAACALVVHLPGGAEGWQAALDVCARKTAETGKGTDWSSDPTWAIVPRR